MESRSIKLAINDDLRHMVQPMTDDERLCLEKEISIKGRVKVNVFNGIIVDSYEEYEIAAELGLPIDCINVPAVNYNETVVWLCRTQLNRTDLTLMMRKYLIGRRSLAEQACERAGLNADLGKKHSRTGQIVTPIRMRLAKEYNYCYNAIRDYEACSKTIDTLFSFDRETAIKLLHGKKYILQSDLIAFAKLSEKQLKIKLEILSNDKYSANETPGIKRTPKYDPDAEISSLSLTIPSWVNLIKRVQNAVTPQISDTAADEIYEKLTGLKTAAENLIGHIMEVL